ncbi:hypothetical protein NE850_11590 [Paraburkholderia sp. USG1]|uniref:hypothetical protein n=1 Tax=Paraburkholderia sp. USG1 TaxID=2952268 RepID=UPI0028632430|nr:hypothetical protein [Paraburkholderia sp. USG1]MDR8396982.1 hypothetical protein [Paraburkholderia sp. USG1]
MATRKKEIDPRGSWTKLYAEMITCHAYRALSMPARCLMWDMKSMLNGTNNGSIGAPFSVMKKQFGWNSSATVSKALYELRAMGFIAITKQGGFKEGARVCSLYRFTDQPVYEHKQSGRQAEGRTYDYDNTHFKSLAEAKALLAVRVAEYQSEGRRRQKKKLPVQEVNRSSSSSEPEARFSGSLNEQGGSISGSRREHCLRVVG